MFGQVPVVTLLSRMEMGFLGIESLTSQNQFPLVLGNTFGQKIPYCTKLFYKDLFVSISNSGEGLIRPTHL